MNELEPIVDVSFFNNSWVTGIGGGILSGFIVYFITKFFFSQKDNSEYLRRVESVNREIVTTLKADISEGDIPDLIVFEALINSTCRKYNVIRIDVYEPHQIAEDLIKEVMDSSFISSDSKRKYCESLFSAVGNDSNTMKNTSDLSNVEELSNIEKQKITVTIKSQKTDILLALFSVSIAIIYALISRYGLIENMYLIFKEYKRIIPVIFGFVAIIFLFFYSNTKSDKKD
ncbi:hypothetical protein [Maridesulfovibrio sp.]|uniref:hypothetical protein n=1 Tax=Maridesulfovibrio sp. TaxID=2795000 RepID=UPI002A18C418|nr:hypothetical protein [Maridesulfovibrio sp.]